MTWVASKLSGAAGALVVEAMKLRNRLLRFGCVSEEFRVVVASLADWMANSSPPWAAYRALIACRLVALETEVDEGEGSEVEDGGGGTQWELEALEFLTQEAEPSGTTLVDACNGFNELSRLEMLWTVRHRWP